MCACSQQNDAEQMEPNGDVAPTTAIETNRVENGSESVPESFSSEFERYAVRLQQARTATRRSGQSMLTGNTLVFDYDERFVRMNGEVVVSDDHGVLTADNLLGSFSVSNEVEHIEATGGVELVSEDRHAQSERVAYNTSSGLIQMDGHASITQGGNRLEGERIRFWIKGDRKMICEPNALLVVQGSSEVDIEGMDGVDLDTEVRANKVVYDESIQQAELTGNVRLRDARAAMNCDKVLIFLKDDNKLDWIEASSEVIIQSEDRRALADRATYDADEGKFTLEGSPKVMQGRNVMTGDRIMFWHETRQMVCEPNARVLLFLDDETRAKFLKDLND